MSDEKKHPAEFQPFWAALKQGRIAFPRCRDCGKFHWYPMKRCPHCRSSAIEWQAVSGEGTLYSFTVVRYPFSPEFRDKLPYVVALVEFADAPGVRLITNLIDTPLEDIRIGMTVQPIFPQGDEATPQVPFRAAA